MSQSEKFPPEKRLHYRREYLKFFGKNEVIRLSECIVFRIPNEQGHYRLGITVKARVNSIERNRIKRRVREEFRKMGEILGGYDYNVVIPGTKKASFPYPRKLAHALRTELPNAVRAR